MAGAFLKTVLVVAAGGGGEVGRIVAGELGADLDRLRRAVRIDQDSREARMQRPVRQRRGVAELYDERDCRIDDGGLGSI